MTSDCWECKHTQQVRDGEVTLYSINVAWAPEPSRVWIHKHYKSKNSIQRFKMNSESLPLCLAPPQVPLPLNTHINILVLPSTQTHVNTSIYKISLFSIFTKLLYFCIYILFCTFLFNLILYLRYISMGDWKYKLLKSI